MNNNDTIFHSAPYNPDWQQAFAHFQQPASQQHGNFLESLIPTVGGIGGGTIGAALGTALLPGIGTIAGGLIGGALGGGGGKLAENALEHQDLTKGVLGEAALNGAFSAGPLRLLQLGGDAARGIKAGAGLADALMQAGDKSVGQGLLKAAGEKLGSQADNIAQRSLKLNASKFNTDFANRAGEEVGQFARRFSIPKLGVQSSVDNIFKPGLQAYGGALSTLGAIPKSDVLNAVKGEASRYLSSAIPDQQAMGKAIIDKATSILDNLPEQINAPDLNAVKSEIMGLVKPGLTDSAGLTNNDVLHSIGNAIRKTINATADKAGATISPDMAQLGFKSTRLGDFGDELHSLGQLLDHAAIKSRVGSGANPIGLTKMLGAVGGAGAMGGPGGALLGAGLTTIANSPVGERAIGGAVGNIADRLTSAAAKSAPYTLGSISKRVLPANLMIGGLNQFSNNTQPTMQTANNPNNQSNPVMAQQYQNGQDSSSDPYGGKFSQQNELAAILADIQSTGGKNIGTISTVFKLANPQPKALNATQQQQSNNAISGLQDIQSMAQMIQQNPNVMIKDAIPGGAIARGLTGTTDYEAARQNVVDVIARMRSGAAISNDEANRYMNMLPKAGDSPQAAINKLSRVADLLGRFANPQPAPTDLASAITQGAF